MKSPKGQLRALEKELPQTAGSPTDKLLSNASSGGLQDRRHVSFVIASTPMSMVRFGVLYLPALLSGPGLLLRRVPDLGPAKKSSRGPEKISADRKR